MQLPRLPPPTRRHTEERLKLLASGSQLLALTLGGAGLLAPVFNAALVAPLGTQEVIAAIAGLAEVVALVLLRYIPFSEDS